MGKEKDRQLMLVAVTIVHSFAIEAHATTLLDEINMTSTQASFVTSN